GVAVSPPPGRFPHNPAPFWRSPFPAAAYPAPAATRRGLHTPPIARRNSCSAHLPTALPCARPQRPFGTGPAHNNPAPYPHDLGRRKHRRLSSARLFSAADFCPLRPDVGPGLSAPAPRRGGPTRNRRRRYGPSPCFGSLSIARPGGKLSSKRHDRRRAPFPDRRF